MCQCQSNNFIIFTGAMTLLPASPPFYLWCLSARLCFSPQPDQQGPSSRVSETGTSVPNPREKKRTEECHAVVWVYDEGKAKSDEPLLSPVLIIMLGLRGEEVCGGRHHRWWRQLKGP